MAIHNTSYDAANTSVRAFLTKVGEKYWGGPFNVGSGPGKEIWLKIKNGVFGGKCCYCGKSTDKLQIEHLIMFNQEGEFAYPKLTTNEEHCIRVIAEYLITILNRLQMIRFNYTEQ